jgi:maleamate amidohydrolase
MRHLSPGRQPALLIIDFVNAYVTPGSPLYGEGCVAAQRPAAQLLAAARAAGIPRLHTNLAYERGGRNGGVFFRKVAALSLFEAGRDPHYGAFAAGLAPDPDETTITKQYASAFFGTNLASTLTALGVDTLLIGGVSTSGCVRATAVDACQHGFVPLVVREAVGDRAPGPHEANLSDLQLKYAEVISLVDAQRYLAELAIPGSGGG